MRSKVKCRISLLSILGVCLIFLGYGLTMCVDDMNQYILPTPVVQTSNDNNLKMYYEVNEKMRSLRESIPVYSIAGKGQNLTLRGEREQSVEATLYAVGKGYFELYHEQLLQGRLISETDIDKGGKVIVIDNETELKLFKGDSALGKSVCIDDVEMQVIGIVDKEWRIGESGEYLAYVPITSSYNNGIRTDTMEITAVGVDKISSPIIMKNTLIACGLSGDFYNLAKLKVSARLSLRWICVFLITQTIFSVSWRANQWAIEQIEELKKAMQRCYFSQILGCVIRKAAMMIVVYCFITIAVIGVVLIVIHPLYLFGEWIPKRIIELSSIQDCIWNLNKTNSASIRYASCLSTRLAVAKELIERGTYFTLLGMISTKRSAK